MFSIFKFKSIQTKMMVVIILFLVLPLIVLSYYYTQTTELMIREEIEKENREMLEQLDRKIQAQMKMMMNAANYFSLSKTIKEVLFNGEIDFEEDYKLAEQQYYKNYMIVNDNIEIVNNTILSGNNYYITLFDFHGNNYTSQPKRNTEKDEAWRYTDWFDKTIEQNGYILWTVHKDLNTGEQLVTLSRLINESIDNKWSGVITITASAQTLFGGMLNEFEADELFIMSETGDIISHLDGKKVGENISEKSLYKSLKSNEQNPFITESDEEKKFVSSKIIEYTGWYLVNSSDYNTLFYRFIELRTYNYVVMGLVLIFFITITYIIILNVTGPLKKLMDSMKQVEEGNFDFSISVTGRDEIAKLGHRFNRMVSEINVLINNIQEKQKKEEQLKLQVLYAQINPHFLFNTLSTIKWMAVINRSNNVAKLIGDLGSLLEMSIKEIDNLITVKEELNNLECYINLQQARYNKRYNIIYEIDDNVLNYLVPKLIFQPIVENSLIHGLDQKREDNMTIKCRGYIENDKIIRFELEDDGKGIEQDVLEKILGDSVKEDKSSKFSGIGVNNVHQRIRMMYGEPYGLKIYSKVGKGTKVIIEMPVNKEVEYVEGNDCR